ncbi:EamA family transporter [Rhizohabitans arisaemae]|uniref:EamA family transporter n=1 Tax=Rhizohabitans arisaemae TaxID=2720610 RepID=UPI0024B14128|nr:EamA family transporter [Rhizohabitans arisaemae]
MTWGLLAIVYVIWGSTYLAIAIVIQTMPPLLSGALRFLSAAAVLALILFLRGRGSILRVTPRELGGAALIGLLLLTTGNGLVSVAEQYISSGLAALLVASMPLWLVVFRVIARDRPHLLTLTGVLVGFGGVALLTFGDGDTAATSTFGVTVVLFASFSWAIGSFFSGRVPMPRDPFAASTYEMLAGGLGLAVGGLIFGERLNLAEFSTASWLGLAYLVVFGSLIAFTSYVWLLENAPISLVSTYAYVNPAVAVLLGVLILSEPVTPVILGAGVVILLGVGLVVSTERLRQPNGGRVTPALAGADVDSG